MRAIRNVMMKVMAIVAGTILCAGLASAAGLNGMKKAGIDIDVCLIDVDGMTLYIYKKDSPGKSTCGAANGCLEKWPVFYVDEFKYAAGFDPTSFAVITREDGKKQITYKGMPLYYFSRDKTADDYLGQGFDNVWHVARP